MARKKPKSTTVRVTCGKCGAEASGIKGRLHRRCSGQAGVDVRAKHAARLPMANRGTWS